jgi:hypothetical protein
MKNFSTVGARLAVGALLAGALAVPAQGANCAFRADAPDQHKVVPGDTLWGISATFLANPWCWPQVWELNREQIHNPHWIYPGQVVYFDKEHGRLSLNKPGAGGLPAAADGGEPPLMRLSPQLRTEGLGKDAVQSIPSNVIEPFLSQPHIVEADEFHGAPRIAASREGNIFLGKGDRAFVAGDLKGGTSFQVFRPGKPLNDPVTNKVIAYESFYLGTVKLDAAAAKDATVHTFTIASASQEMGAGDLLMPAPPTPVRNYAPHQPEQNIDARVVASYSGLGDAGQNQVVSINRGALDGLDIGAVLQLYHFGKTVDDPGGDKGFLGLKKPTVKLPDQQVGTLFVFRVFKHVSYGLIMQVTEPISVGDVAKSPE